MRRLLAVMTVLLALSGCKASTPSGGPVDPFFGRTRIEPPGTGAVAVPGTGDPYYSVPKTSALPRSGGVPIPTSSSGTRQPPSSSPGVASQASTSQATGAQTGSQRGDVVAIPSSARVASDRIASRQASISAPSGPPPAVKGSTGAAVATTNSAALPPPPPVPQKLVQTVSPRPKPVERTTHNSATTAVPNTWPSPQPATTPKPVDILDLPAARAANNAQSSTTAPAGGVVPVSATQDVDVSASPAIASKDGRYAYDTKYEWLRGRLEYSQVDRLWRLRYIPMEGPSDVHGGSVVLAQTPKLSGLERGDFVEVHGRLVAKQADGKASVAGYEVSDLKRLAP